MRAFLTLSVIRRMCATKSFHHGECLMTSNLSDTLVTHCAAHETIKSALNWDSKNVYDAKL